MWLQRIFLLINILGFFIPVVTIGVMAQHSPYDTFSSLLPFLFLFFAFNSLPFTILIFAGITKKFKETKFLAIALAVVRLLLFVSTILVHYSVLKSQFTNPADSGESGVSFFIFPVEASIVLLFLLIVGVAIKFIINIFHSKRF